jgi:hypothetical protein
VTTEAPAQFAVVTVPLIITAGDFESEPELVDPGIVVGAAFALSKRVVVVAGEPDFEERIVIFVQCAPGFPRRKRRFLVVPPGVPLGVPEGFTVEHRASPISANTGSIAHVYEVIDLAAAKPARSKLERARA